MEEKKPIKVRLSTVVYLVIILVLAIALGVVYYLGFVKDDKSNNMLSTGEVVEKNDISINTQNPEPNNNVEEESIKLIELSDKEKIKINKQLKENLHVILRTITNDGAENMEKNIDLLNNKENKAQVLWYSMKFEDAEFYNNEELATGEAIIDVDTAKKYYNKIFDKTSEKDFQDLVEAYNDVDYFSVKDNKIYGGFPTGWGISPYELKINMVEFNSSTDNYKAIVDVLKPDNDNEDELINMINKYSNENVLEWPEELNYAKMEIEYKKEEDGNYKLISLMFVK